MTESPATQVIDLIIANLEEWSIGDAPGWVSVESRVTQVKDSGDKGDIDGLTNFAGILRRYSDNIYQGLHQKVMIHTKPPTLRFVCNEPGCDQVAVNSAERCKEHAR